MIDPDIAGFPPKHFQNSWDLVQWIPFFLAERFERLPVCLYMIEAIVRYLNVMTN